MSLRPQWVGEPPEETVRVARAAFPKGNLYLTIRDHLGVVYEDSAFATLFSATGQPAIAAWRLAWVTILQFAEGLTDRQAAEAVRSRIDWKYLLGLPLEDAGFDYSVLSEFRGRLVAGELEYQLLDKLLTVCKAQGWLKAGGRQRTDSTHVLAAVERLHRYELVKAVLETALNRCAQRAPEWLKAKVPQDWFNICKLLGCPSLKYSSSASLSCRTAPKHASALSVSPRLGSRCTRRSSCPASAQA